VKLTHYLLILFFLRFRGLHLHPRSTLGATKSLRYQYSVSNGGFAREFAKIAGVRKVSKHPSS
jgi:hypothetical protein